ncbi:MAG: glycogen debranching protein, partial [Planctomycetes bacterium]|nr:glycogen debranching protein [Planctomycetota bacterium]
MGNAFFVGACWRGRARCASSCARSSRAATTTRSRREQRGLRFEARVEGDALLWSPYGEEIAARSDGAYRHEPLWYRNFVYDEERERGLDHVEDLASPGEFSWELRKGSAHLLLGRGSESFQQLREREGERRKGLPTPLDRAADAYIVRRGRGETIVAGYPWFTDWGRDTFIALRGLGLAAGRKGRRAGSSGSGARRLRGNAPQSLPDAGDQPEFNSVDASLWFVVAAAPYVASEPEVGAAVQAILEGYRRGTRHGIRMDGDGLLACGEPGVQLTWMDAKVGDWVVTPRTGKPVEVQALWLNALAVGGAAWRDDLARGLDSFEARFWNGSHLRDVVDPAEESFRPNQILAVGGLPLPLLTGERARQIVDAVEERLLTPLGLRSLSPDDPSYVGRYRGGVRERDGAYHQGTAWPWLLGPFVEAWVRVRGSTARVKAEARKRFL